MPETLAGPGFLASLFASTLEPTTGLLEVHCWI